MGKNHKGFVMIIAFILFLTIFYGCSYGNSVNQNCDIESKSNDLYVSNDGDDSWSGMISQPNKDKSDGPLGTIQRARDIIREKNEAKQINQDIAVWIRGGNYNINEPIEFIMEDSYSFKVTYAAYKDEKPVINGGVQIDGWKAEKLNGQEVWVAYIPEVENGELYFKQLFVNDKRSKRTSLPKDGFYQIKNIEGVDCNDSSMKRGTDYFTSFEGDIKNWKNICDVDVIVYHYWVDERMPIQSFDEETGLVTSSLQSSFTLLNGFRHEYAKYKVENVFEALCQPGEWYLDRTEGKVYYIPLEREKIENIKAYYPVIKQFIIVNGNPENNEYIENISFKGLTFMNSEWIQQDNGKATPSQASNKIPGAIYFKGAKSCSINECSIKHIGWYGIELSYGCSNIEICYNEITDIGAGGIKIIGSRSENKEISLRTSDITISDNHIYDGGNVFHSGVGVLSAGSFNNVISHNHIHDLYYSGISCGWSWGFGYSVSENNLIEKNYIHDIGQGMLSDMGGIYILGVQPGTIIRGNLIHDVKARIYDGCGIYLDEGASNILVQNNICYNMSTSCLYLHYGKNNEIYNNIFAFGKEDISRRKKTSSENDIIFQHNICVSDGVPFYAAKGNCSLDDPGLYWDNNLYWDLNKENWGLNEIEAFEQWLSFGYDQNSIIENPKFTDLENCNFALLEDSPAFKIGFESIDMSDVGIR